MVLQPLDSLASLVYRPFLIRDTCSSSLASLVYCPFLIETRVQARWQGKTQSSQDRVGHVFEDIIAIFVNVYLLKPHSPIFFFYLYTHFFVHFCLLLFVIGDQDGYKFVIHFQFKILDFDLFM